MASELFVQAVAPPARNTAPAAQTGNAVSTVSKELKQSDIAASRQVLAGSSTPQNQTKLSSIADKTALDESVQWLNEHAQSLARELHFRIDDDTDRIVIEVRDPTTDEVIRSIPPKEVLSMIKNLQEFDGGHSRGFLIEESA